MQYEQDPSSGLHLDNCLGKDGRIGAQNQRHPTNRLRGTSPKFCRITVGKNGYGTDGQAEP